MLTEGHKNILYAKMIDKVYAQGGNQTECHRIIVDYYENTLRTKAPDRAWLFKMSKEAKSLWLTNFSIDSLEDYKKSQFLKSEMLESRINQHSTKDMVDKAKVIVDIYKYQDNLAGMNSSNGIDIFIGIDTPREAIINALDIDEVDDVTPTIQKTK